tara:strand:+ start:59 stop:1339 length:1281 start_codon:yes stop_codon:yes gene_type:complete
MILNEIKYLIRNYLLSNLKSKNNLSIGVEVENILYDYDLKRINPDISSIISTEGLRQQLIKDDDLTISIEPGGQIEYASSPNSSLKKLLDEIFFYRKKLIQICNDEKIIVSDFGVDSIYKNIKVPITKRKKYQLMYKLFSKKGHLSHEMMLNTASMQLSLDYSSLEQAEFLAFLSDSIHPFFSIIFSNSPFWHSKKSYKKNVRELIWSQTDSDRCNSLFEHGITNNKKLIENYIDFLLKVPAIFRESSNSISNFNGTIEKYLIELHENNGINNEKIKTVLRQIFTNVRFKDILEIRGADTPPFGYELAPISFLKGLFRNKKSLDRLFELCKNWGKKDRLSLICLSRDLSLDKVWKRKRIFSWCEDLISIAMDGLDSDEYIYLNSFAEKFLNHGPFTLSIQNSFNKNNLSIKEFIKKRWFEKKELFE